MDNKIDAPRTAEDLLAIIRDFFHEGFYSKQGITERIKVWDVLTSLRGPDGETSRDIAMKTATTAVIRYKVFGSTSCISNMVQVSGDSSNLVGLRNKLHPDTHFIRHTQAAFLALGLKWDTLNDIPGELPEDTLGRLERKE